MFAGSEAAVGQVVVTTTVEKGHDPSFWASRAVDRIVSVGGNCHPLIAQQAEAFKDRVRDLAQYYIELARKEERATICAKVREAGQHELADAIGRL